MEPKAEDAHMRVNHVTMLVLGLRKFHLSAKDAHMRVLRTIHMALGLLFWKVFSAKTSLEPTTEVARGVQGRVGKPNGTLVPPGDSGTLP